VTMTPINAPHLPTCNGCVLWCWSQHQSAETDTRSQAAGNEHGARRLGVTRLLPGIVSCRIFHVSLELCGSAQRCQDASNNRRQRRRLRATVWVLDPGLGSRNVGCIRSRIPDSFYICIPVGLSDFGP